MKVSAPGKLMLSGEWSVLEVGCPCIVMAVNKYSSAEIKKNEKIVLDAPDVGLNKIEAEFDDTKLNWKKELSPEEKAKIIVSEKAIELTLQYLAQKRKKIKNFYIKTDSSQAIAKTATGNQKIGFGSSAAISVAIVAGLLKLHGIGIKKKESKDLIYKIASTAHYLAQGKVGSAFDIAAATFGGTIVYKRFDPNWLISEINTGKKISEIMDSEWPAYFAEELLLPEKFVLSVGYTGYSASTKELILKLNSFKETQKERYWQIINGVKEITVQLIEAIKAGKKEKIIELLNENRKSLQQLSTESQNNLETKELSLMSDIAQNLGAAGKFSGAGGGDCAIAVSFDKKTGKKIEQEWEKNGLQAIKINISKKGVYSTGA